MRHYRTFLLLRHFKKQTSRTIERFDEIDNKSDYLLQNFSNAKVGLFTGFLLCFVACVLCTEDFS